MDGVDRIAAERQRQIDYEVEMKSEPSAGAKRTAKHVIAFMSAWFCQDDDAPRPEAEAIEHLERLISELMAQDWIRCSERMPTEDHGDIDGRIMWRFDEDQELPHTSDVFHMAAHWDPTNIDGIKRVWDMYEIECVSWMPFPPGLKEK